MLQSLLVIPVFVLIVRCVWIRRHSWRLRWHGALTLAIALQGVGYALSAPIQSRGLGHLLFMLTGTAHVRDYFAHLCFLASAGSLIYMTAKRLLTDRQTDRFMRRVEIPGGVAAAGMLVCLVSSRSLHHQPHPKEDFFEVPCDGWLIAYWLIYLGLSTYLLLCLVDLMFALREDPRNRLTATLYITAVRIGFVTIAVAGTKILEPSRHISAVWIWAPLCVSSSLVALASAHSWQRRQREQHASLVEGECRSAALAE